MAKKRKKLIRKITENRKVKRVLWGIFIFLALVCLGAAFGEKAFRASVDIIGFEANYADVSSKTRKALKSELENFVLLNTGNSSRRPKFVVREGQNLVTNEDEDGNKTSAFLIDSDELQISARVQMYWSKSLSDPDASFVVRIDCAAREESKYGNNYCFSRSTGEAARKMTLDNLGLLASYGAPDEAIKIMQNSMLSYLKIAYPEATSALVDRESVKNGEAEIRANLALDNGNTFELIIGIEDDWTVKLQSGNNVIWESSADRKTTAYRHYSVLKKNLPVEIKTESGSRFTLGYVDKGQLSINSVECAEKTRDMELKQAVTDWLEVNNFEAEAYKIKLKNSCEN